MTKFISVLIFLSLIGLNAYIYFNTNEKIKKYSKSPPFRMEDFTKSQSKNRNSKIKNLTDKDKTSFWFKEQDSIHPEYDLELELTLTHIYKESKFQKKEFHSITFYSCLVKENISPFRSPDQLQVDLFLREAINIDKELRLPKDTKITSFLLDFQNSDKVKIDISKVLTLQDSNTFPENISIVTLFMKDKSSVKNGKICMAEIEID